MILDRFSYFAFMNTMINMPPGFFTYQPFPVAFSMNCNFDSNTLTGDCISQNGVTARATLVKN